MKVILPIIFTVMSFVAVAQQVPDTIFQVSLKNPAFKIGGGPMIMIDEAHNNFHTAKGRFRPFALLLEKDGYQVKQGAGPFSQRSLHDVKILVISNALHSSNKGNWVLPTPSAFTDNEISTVKNWVENGNSLFLISDHMPFPGCNEKLAAAFGFKFTNGFALNKKEDGPDLFCYSNGRLQKNKLTEDLDSIYTSTGQAFEIPANAKGVLVLDNEFENKQPKVAWKFDHETLTTSASGMKQGACLEFGKGKVFVSGEAAMFSAQKNGRNKIGFNYEKAKNNVKFLLNVMHWLGE